MSRLLHCLCLALIAASMQSAIAHTSVETLLSSVNHEIALRPGDYALYVRRAELEREQHDWTRAEADVALAEQLAPADERQELELTRGRIFQEAGDSGRAIASINAYLAAHPSDIVALRIRALAFAQMGLFDEAIADYSTLLALAGSRSPELWLEQARLWLRAGEPDAALDAVDEAVEIFGPLITLVELAFDTEIDLGDYTGALARIDAVPAALSASPRWLWKRGLVLDALNRPDEASQAYAQARRAIGGMPLRRQATPAMQALLAQLSSIEPKAQSEVARSQ